MRLFQDARRTTHRVTIVVYVSTAPAGIGQGVSIEARADEQEIIYALHALESRGWKKPLQEVMGASSTGSIRPSQSTCGTVLLAIWTGNALIHGCQSIYLGKRGGSAEVRVDAHREHVVVKRRGTSSRKPQGTARQINHARQAEARIGR